MSRTGTTCEAILKGIPGEVLAIVGAALITKTV